MSAAPTGISSAFDAVRADYDMSRESRFVRRRTGIQSQGSSADWHYRTEIQYYRDIEKARDMDRNDAVVGQIVDRAVQNIVQGGFSLDPQTGDDSLNKDLKARWLAWAGDPEQCDVAGEFTWHDFERHCCRAMLADGDCVTLGIDNGSLQHLEAHTIQTSTKMPGTFLGVTKLPNGRRTLYHVMTDPLDPTKSTRGTSRPIPVRNAAGVRTLFHVYNPKRLSQTRGITAFAPIFAMTGMFEDINFAKLVQQQIVSCFAVFRTRQYIADIPGSTPEGYASSPSSSSAESGSRPLENVVPGMEIIGDYGEKLEGFSPNVPNAEFFMHVKLMLQLIGVNLGLPLCLVLMDGSETNFSGWRGAVDEARKGWKSIQRGLVARKHKPTYELKVRQWLAGDASLRAAARMSSIDILGHHWHPPAWQYIQPVEDAQGDALRLQNSLASQSQIHGERGRDWDDESDRIVSDNASAIAKAQAAADRLNSQYKFATPLGWQNLINLPMANGVQMTMQDPNVVKQQTEGQE